VATITQIQKTTLTPAVTALLTGPLPSNLPPPPAGYNYEVVPTPGGGAERTGNLISTGRTVYGAFDLADNPALQQFVKFGAGVAAVAAPEILAGAPVLAQKAAPAVLDTLKGGALWRYGTTSLAAYQDFLTQQVRQQAMSGLTSLVRNRLPLPTIPFFPTSIPSLTALARLPVSLRAQALTAVRSISPSWPPLVQRLLALQGRVL
jgi:hypothetical protein